MPEARPTIERDKIKHRRPNDHLFDDDQTSVAPESFVTDDADDQSYADDTYYDDAEPDWTSQQGPDWTDQQGPARTDQEEDDRAASAWEEEPEDDWVLDRDDEPSAQALAEDDYAEESGVVWEDDAFSARAPDHHSPTDYPDEVTFGPDGDSYDSQDSVGPEMELAGRRDIRPKAPRPAPPPRAPAPRPPERRQRRQSQPQSRRPGIDWTARAEPDRREPAANDPSFGQRPRAAQSMGDAHPTSPVAESGRFSRTRAMLGTAADGSEETLLQPTRRAPRPERARAPQSPAPRQRRRKARAAAPRLDQTFAAQYGRRRRYALFAIVLLALLGGGGWFAYQSIGPGGIQPMIDRLTALIPLPGSSRTAADTSFGDQGSAEALSAERALSALEERIRQQGGDEAAPAQAAPPADPAATRADGPPIPKFKPLPGATRSLTGKVPARGGAAAPAGGISETELAADGDDPQTEPSIFEQLWRYLSPG